ncbi:hypothetical protein F4556_002337 [Kitasatospora gansuensis]|uniref:Uncharacterized protein n=1 Tax=Kitasatospora gansuensis TaxID=258050 RepID=A0A7W7SAP3_9ACTN|nr:hypothetical protein [Kitasatospora gansuensis]MBB4946802.1 hypothetical protein [Kitasatospora gansuensis]
MADRYEPRPLPRLGRALQMWGAWDHRHRDWVRRIGTGAGTGEPEPFTSEIRVELWAAQQTDTTPTTKKRSTRVHT